jgi:hypothetical protein
LHRYRTEIVVPADRYVCLQLPEGLPDGPATVTVDFHGHDPAAPGDPMRDDVDDPDREDIEWWEEFEDEAAPRG